MLIPATMKCLNIINASYENKIIDEKIGIQTTVLVQYEQDRYLTLQSKM